MKRLPAAPSRDHSSEVGTLVPHHDRQPDGTRAYRRRWKGTSPMSTSTPPAAPGWYPVNGQQQMYWTGSDWSGDVAPLAPGWQYQRSAVASGVLHAFGVVMLWTLVGVACMVIFLAAIMGTS